MKLAIPTIADEDLEIANSAEIGAESLLLVAYDESLDVGEFRQEAVGTTWTPDRSYRPPSPTSGRDLAMICANGVRSSEEIVVVLGVHYDAAGVSTAGTATARFNPPAGAQNDTFNFPLGLAVDIGVDGVGNTAKKIITVDTVNSVTGGDVGNRFQIVAFPEGFVPVQCAQDKNPTLPTSRTIPIACGYNAARWIKKGRSEVPTLEASAKYTGAGDGLMRLNGHRCTAMIEVWKEDRLLTERMLFGNWRPTVQPRKGDGDAEAETRATGNYEIFGVFV
jgi:hypothetical protein